MEKIKMNEFFNYKFLSNVEVANDKSKVAFIVKNANEKNNNYDSNLWLYDKAVKQLTQTNDVIQYSWLDNDNVLIQVKADDSYHSKFKKINVTSGITSQLYSLPIMVSSFKLVDKQLVITASIDANNPDYYSLSLEQQADIEKKDKEEKDYEVLDEVPFWFNGQGFINKKRTALFTMDINCPDTLKRITTPLTDIKSLDVDEDNVYLLVEESVSLQTRNLTLLKYNLKTKSLVKIYKDVEMYSQKVIVVNHEVMLLSGDEKEHGINENPYLYKLVDGKLVLVYKNKESIGNSVGSDCRLGGSHSVRVVGKQLFYLSTRRNSANIYSFVDEETAVLEKEGSIDDFAVADSKIYLIGMYENKLQELYQYDLTTKKLEQLTNLNTEVLQDKYVATPNKLHFNSHDWELDGWVLLPKDYDATKKYPAILDVHGGPKTVYGEVFYHEMQYWANAGYFVMFCNPIGGDGRGNEFADLRGKYGTIDFDSLMVFVDEVLKKYPSIDPTKVCETGGSYGGFMTNWIIGHTNRFAACASQRSIANFMSFAGVSDIGYEFVLDQCDVKNVIDGMEKVWEHSPLKYVNKVVTPTLFIHSDEDFRCPVNEGIQMFTGLVQRGIEARICYFKGENHELSRGGKPLHRLRRIKEITNWFDKHTK